MPRELINTTDWAATTSRSGASISDRIAAFAMLDGMKQATQAEKSLLTLIGFSNSEIADMLQTSAAAVAQNVYSERQKLSKKAGAKKGAAGPELSPNGST